MNAPTLNQSAFDRWERFCHSRLGLSVLFLWAMAEATVWPIVPDFVLIPMAAGGRRTYWKVLSACILGMALGGVAIYLFAYFAPAAAEAILLRLPVVQTFMIERVRAALDRQGLLAFWTQPWSGLSYKIYAVVAAARGWNPVAVLSLAIFARALRMFSLSAVVALAARRFPKFFRDYWLYIAVVYVIGFGYIWFTTQLME